MKDKVSIQLSGGLGNNLFQIACAYAYSLKHNKELILVNEKFGITHNALDTYKDNVLRKIDFVNKKDFSGFKVYQELVFNYQEIPFIEGDVLLLGYYQSELYFKEYEKEIRELFSFPEELINSIKEKHKDILNKETCSVHARRTNYIQLSDSHPVQSVNYYMKAIRKINMPESGRFVVFSDDIEWCKTQFLNEMFVFIEAQKDYEDLLLMSMCQNNIIANSSFSWWGAWLNNNLNKHVYAPSVWFGKSAPNNTKDLYCEGWEKI